MKRGAVIGFGIGITLVAVIWSYTEILLDYEVYSFDHPGQLMALGGMPTTLGLARLPSVWSVTGTLYAGAVAVVVNWTVIGLGLGGLISTLGNLIAWLRR